MYYMAGNEKPKDAAKNFRLPHEMMLRVQAHANIHHGGNISDVIRNAVEAYLPPEAEPKAPPLKRTAAPFGYQKTLLGAMELDLREQIESSTFVACMVTDFDRWARNHRHSMALRERFKSGAEHTYIVIPIAEAGQPLPIPPVLEEIFGSLSYEELEAGKAAFNFFISYTAKLAHFQKIIFATEKSAILSESIFGFPYAQVYRETLEDGFNIVTQTVHSISSIAIKARRIDPALDIFGRYVESRKPKKSLWRR
jgi:hypothetical protein